MNEYISREDVLHILMDETSDGLLLTFAELEEMVSALPAADVAPMRRGQWDGESDGYAEDENGEMVPVVDVWYCSECGHCIDEGIDDEALLPNYCPNCGAKMDGKEDKT